MSKELSLKELMLTVKKVKGVALSNDGVGEIKSEGLIFPLWNNSANSYLEDNFLLYVTDGTVLNFRLSLSKIEDTEITDEEILKKIDNLKIYLKEEYRVRSEIQKLKEEYEYNLEQLKIRSKEILKKKLNEILKKD